jgi:hypothetical protein
MTWTCAAEFPRFGPAQRHANEAPPRRPDQCQRGDEEAGVSDASQEIRVIARRLAQMGDFVCRPDLNADIIRSLDLHSRKLHEIADRLELRPAGLPGRSTGSVERPFA